MARILPAQVLGLVLLALILNQQNTVEPYEVVFSDDTTTDLTKGDIDVTGLMRQDWLSLPLIGFCGLAGKFNTPHKIDTTAVRGTLYTTFEYLTADCTAEYKRDNNSCAVLTSAFGACFNFPLDRKTSSRPWGYCSNFNFRVSYLWVPNTTTSAATTWSTSLRRSQIHLQSAPSPGADGEILPPVCTGIGCKSRNTDSKRPRTTGRNHRTATGTYHPGAGDRGHPALGLSAAPMVKDTASLKQAAATQACASGGGRLDTGCDWRYSNLVPVAWDGIQNVLVSGQSLQSADSQYALIMQADCNLVLYKKGADGKYEWNAKWAAYSQFNDPFTYNCSAELRPNGNLVVRDPAGRMRWASGRTSSLLYSSALAVTRQGAVVVYEGTSAGVLWSSAG